MIVETAFADCGVSFYDFLPMLSIAFVLAIFLSWLRCKFKRIERLIQKEMKWNSKNQ